MWTPFKWWRDRPEAVKRRHNEGGYAFARRAISDAFHAGGADAARANIEYLETCGYGSTEHFDNGMRAAIRDMSKSLGLDAEQLPAPKQPPITDKCERHNGLRDAHALLLAYMEEINAEHHALQPAWHGGTRPRHVELTHMGAALVELGHRMEKRGWEIITNA